MTPAQESLKQYLLEKLKEGAFAGLKTPGAILKKAGTEFLVDVPAVIGDLGIQGLGQVVIKKAEQIAREVSKRGFFTVLNELKESLDMQYQRGMDRKRRGG